METGESTGRPVAPGVFEVRRDGPVLIGATCPSCGVTSFPVESSCPRCLSETMEPCDLPRSGVLWSWTTQGFPPKSPPFRGAASADSFEPYLVGYIDLGRVIVEARLVGVEPAAVRIGQAVELRLVPFPMSADDGSVDDVLIHAFAPVGAP